MYGFVPKISSKIVEWVNRYPGNNYPCEYCKTEIEGASFSVVCRSVSKKNTYLCGKSNYSLIFSILFYAPSLMTNDKFKNMDILESICSWLAGETVHDDGWTYEFNKDEYMFNNILSISYSHDITIREQNSNGMDCFESSIEVIYENFNSD